MLMMKKRRCILSLILLLCMFAAPASAAQVLSSPPTPTPMPRRLADCITVKACIGGEWKALKSNLIYIHEMGIHADGILMFQPLASLLADERAAAQLQILTAQLTETFDTRVIIDDSADEGSAGYTIYRLNGTALMPCLDQKPEWTALETGRYLIEIDHHVSRGTEYYRGKSFLWLDI